MGRLASEVLGLNKARVSPLLGQELPGDSSHQTRRGQDGGVGLLERSFAFVEVSEVGRATDGDPGGLGDRWREYGTTFNEIHFATDPVSQEMSRGIACLGNAASTRVLENFGQP